MNWHLLGLSFITVFLSELGDKSQIAAIALCGQGKSPRAIFFGTAIALLLTSLLGAFAGGVVAEFLPTRTLKAIAAVGFAFLALRLLFFNEEESSDLEITQAIVEESTTKEA
ncbi:MAG: TMEM165/GDT1 family protein [Cyanobacteria bacterium P01_A01_bin.84]